MLPRDLADLRVPARPSLSADGATVVFAIGGCDRETDDYVSQLWLSHGAEPARQLTYGHCDTAPAISPDGTNVAYLRRQTKGAAQLWVAPLNGGEPRCLTEAPLGVSGTAWAPDGTRLAYLARVPEAGRYEPDGEPTHEPPRLITKLTYRHDNLGYTFDRPQQAFVVPFDPADAAPPEPRQLTETPGDVTQAVWLGRGDRLALVGDFLGHDADLRRDLCLVSADGGEVTIVPLGQLSPERVEAGDGFLVLLATDLGADGTDFVARNTAAYRLETDSGALTQLTDPQVQGLVAEPGALAVRGGWAYALVESRGSVELLRIDASGAGGRSETLVAGPAVVTSFDVGRSTEAIAMAVTRPGTPGELEWCTAPSGPWLAVTRCGEWCEQWIREPVEFTTPGRDGYPVHGWVTTPATGGPHPALLLVHGGPYAQFTGSFFDETQVYVRAGYAVVQCNPRGSSGYGQAHGRAIAGAFGTVDAADVLDFFDAALAEPRFALDSERTAVMGGSYGGYMAGWLTTHTDRFSCAIVERGFLDAASFVGSSDIGWYFGRRYLGPDAASPQVQAQNPMSHIDRVTTPTLVIHSENDLRCPIEQGQRWFTELKLRGVDTELLIFPGEGHELSRSGLPSHRVARFEHILRWLDGRLNP